MRLLKALLAPLCTLCIIAGCTSCGGGGASTPVNHDRPAFDRAAAFAALTQQCDFGPRNPGSTGHESCRAWLASEMTALADKTVLQDFNADTLVGGAHQFENILGLFGSAAAGTPILLAAHWDTRPIADEDPNPANRSTAILGANDGASGVAVLLELGRLMKARAPSRPVILAFVDAEDSGLASAGAGKRFLGFCVGSDYLANHWPSDLPWPGEMVLLDMVGTDGVRNPRLQPTGVIGAPAFKLEAASVAAAPLLVDRIWSAASARGHSAFVRQPGGEIIDDHRPFIEKGVAAVDIIHFAPAEWHTIDDTPAHCSQDTLYQVGDTLVSILWD